MDDSIMVCATLVSLSEPFNAGSQREAKFVLSECDPIIGGDLRIRISPDDAKGMLVGDVKMLRLRTA